jgi:hypothetical protein
VLALFINIRVVVRHGPAACCRSKTRRLTLTPSFASFTAAAAAAGTDEQRAHDEKCDGYSDPFDHPTD